jgi:hypothetical protein
MSVTDLICPITGLPIKQALTLPCTHVFEKQALEEFLRKNKHCPVCNTAVNNNNIEIKKPNMSVIKIASLKLKVLNKVTGLSTRTKQPKLTDPLLENLKFSVETDGVFYNLSIKAPDCVERRPVSIVAVIDISGSMGTSVGKAEGSKAFTRLDLVKHVLNVLITSLNKDDCLSLITFSDETEIVLDICEMDEENKDIAKHRVNDLRPTNCTRTAKAIKEAYKVLENSPQNYVNSILLLTDGVDSDGEDYLRTEFDKIFKQRNIQFNSFGFGSDIWSHLLQELALKGDGIFGYIPDQTMIGTIFINFMANTLLTYEQGIYYEIDDNYELVFAKQPKKFTINFGQTRNFLLRKKRSYLEKCPSIKIWKDMRNVVQFMPQNHEIINNFDLKEQIARNKILQFCFDTKLPSVEARSYEDSLELTPTEFRTEFKQLNPQNLNQQQLKLSLSYWETWGGHYIRSFLFSHLYELCLNFKSPSMQIYKTEKFELIADELTDLFCTISPPEPTGYTYCDSVNSHGVINMANLMDPSGGCILESCKVKLNSGVFIPIGQLRKGHVLSNGAKVVCLIKMLHNKPLIKIGKLFVTPYHPIFYDNEWIFPIDFLKTNNERASLINLEKSSYVCNLILDKEHTVDIEGIKLVSLGHDLENGILKHPYYGTSKVIEEHSRFKGWKDGLVHIKKYFCEKDENGLVCSTKVLEYDF